MRLRNAAGIAGIAAAAVVGYLIGNALAAYAVHEMLRPFVPAPLAALPAATPAPPAIFADGFEYTSTACPATITGPDGITRTRLTRGAVSYGVYPAQRLNADLTTWDGLWGYNSTTGPVTPWPGVGGSSPVIGNAVTTSYVAAGFQTGKNTAQSGSFSHPSYIAPPVPGGPRQRLTMAISQQCGDFSRYLPTPGCLVSNVPASDAALVHWKLTSNAPGSWCNLHPVGTYYVNLLFTDTTICKAGACLMGTVSYHN